MKANDLQGQVQCLGLIKTEQLLLLKECLWLVVTSLFTSFIPFKTVKFQAINLICLLFCLVLVFFYWKSYRSAVQSGVYQYRCCILVPIENS